MVTVNVTTHLEHVEWCSLGYLTHHHVPTLQRDELHVGRSRHRGVYYSLLILSWRPYRIPHIYPEACDVVFRRAYDLLVECNFDCRARPDSIDNLGTE